MSRVIRLRRNSRGSGEMIAQKYVRRDQDFQTLPDKYYLVDDTITPITVTFNTPPADGERVVFYIPYENTPNNVTFTTLDGSKIENLPAPLNLSLRDVLVEAIYDEKLDNWDLHYNDISKNAFFQNASFQIERPSGTTYLVDAVTGSRTATLPADPEANENYIFEVNGAAGSNFNIDGNGNQIIFDNNPPENTLVTALEADTRVFIVYDGTNWRANIVKGSTGGSGVTNYIRQQAYIIPPDVEVGTKYLAIGGSSQTWRLPTPNLMPNGFWLEVTAHISSFVTMTTNGGTLLNMPVMQPYETYRFYINTTGQNTWWWVKISGAGGGGSIQVGTGNPSSSQALNGSEGDLFYNKSAATLFIVADIGGKRWVQIV